MGDAALLTAGGKAAVRWDGRGFAKAFPEIGSGVMSRTAAPMLEVERGGLAPEWEGWGEGQWVSFSWQLDTTTQCHDKNKTTDTQPWKGEGELYMNACLAVSG